MREITARVPSGLRRIPDGETGDRAGWIFYQAHRFLQLPWLVPVQPFDPAEGDYEHMPQLRLADGADPATVTWPEPGYADAYLRSYETFTALRKEGVIPGGVRFQVEYPTPLASISAYVVPEHQQVLLPAYEQAMFADLHRLLAAIPRHEVAVQWDVAVEFSILEEFYGPIGPGVFDAIIGNLARCVDAVPAEVPVGLHLCYGDWGHQHFKQPESLALQVRVAECGHRVGEADGQLRLLHRAAGPACGELLRAASRARHRAGHRAQLRDRPISPGGPGARYHR